MDTILINGVTYYKLDVSQYGYSGDTAKHCSLNTEDLDQNFHILRGDDILSVAIVDNRLILRRLNGNEISVELNESTNITAENLTFYYNAKDGKLEITYPDGEKATISGFTTSIYTDSTLHGDGTRNDPLRISRTAKTGSYAPANEFIELTTSETLPTDGIDAGYRIVTREFKNNLGKLYNKDGVNVISEYLENTNSEWRIPTKEDWDKLLDSLEPSNYVELGFLPHSSTTIDYLGKNAAQQLKSEYFNYNENPIDEDSTCGYNTIGFNIIPVGIGVIDEYEAIKIEGFLEKTCFWTNDDYENGKYVKGFFYNTNKVLQSFENENFYSIRLVKDYDGSNYNENEFIFGQTYEAILDRKNSLIWLSDNLNVSRLGNSLIKGENYIDTEILGFVGNFEYAFYINEFDGNEWVKKELKEGDSIVIFSRDKEDGITEYYRRWIVKEGELKSYEDYANEKINGLIDELDIFINERLEGIIKDTVKSYLEGTMNEIKITETETGKLKIGFYDNTIFG